MKKLWMSLAVVSALALAGCGGGEKKEEKKAEAPAAAPAAAPADDANAGTITGKVAYSGEKVNPKTISMDATPACSKAHATPQKSEEVVLNDNGTLRYTFVWIKAGLPEKQWPAAAGAVALDQSGCVYKPHMIGVRAGQDIEVTNSDPTNHNIHPLPKANREWNESQPPKGDKKIKQFAREEVMIPVKCNVHPWMKSYVGVVNHPFFAVTGEDGSFSLKGVPPGEYTVEAWHEKYGAKEIKVKVEAKGSATADFDFKG
jgi:plastocyanin